MSCDFFAIKWTDEESKGFIDLFPRKKLVEAKLGSVRLEHQVIGPRKSIYRALCEVVTKDNVSTLDYTKYPFENDKWGMFLGEIRLKFSTSSLDELISAEWRDAQRKKFSAEYLVIIPYKEKKIPQYKLQKDTSTKKRREFRERPKQIAFRRSLEKYYSSECCISGCHVNVALQAAHIDGFNGDPSNNPQNGLLLRSDLHALFDADMLAIKPDTREVYFHTTVREWPEYKMMHLKVLREPNTPAARPSEAALKKRWRAFQKSKGDEA
ncbi:MAG: HNH endonuclease [Parvibaculum sp.]|uniref:HNH endonuclease n=1 Tax=Parvibaculum sp. TaxID=2024848 RepID=UPI00284D360D|nr:HNH endonuclease [Parvibaculum sp.]MDR3498568.1 HNH endonuclease [Parvibaculum sp.]